MLHRWTALQHVQSMKFELIQLGKCIPSPQHIGEPVVNTQNIGQLVYEIQLLRTSEGRVMRPLKVTIAVGMWNLYPIVASRRHKLTGFSEKQRKDLPELLCGGDADSPRSESGSNDNPMYWSMKRQRTKLTQHTDRHNCMTSILTVRSKYTATVGLPESLLLWVGKAARLRRNSSVARIFVQSFEGSPPKMRRYSNECSHLRSRGLAHLAGERG